MPRHRREPDHFGHATGTPVGWPHAHVGPCSHPRSPRRAPLGADPRAGRRLGRAAPGARAHRGGLPGRALRRSPARPEGRPRPPEPHPARRRGGHPSRLPGGRRRHRLDEHVHRDLDRPGRLRAAGRRLRHERRGRPPRQGGRGGVPGPVRGRLGRPDEPDALDVTQGGGRRVPHGHLRPGVRGLRGADPRAPRRRRRPPADRDDLRHAERQGRDRRRQGRGARAAADGSR